MKRIFVRQDDFKDCGISCLLMIIKSHGGNSSKEYLRNLTNTTKNGTSAYDLIIASEKFNFKSFGLRGAVDELKDEYYPVISHVIKNNKYQHFLVIYEYNSKKRYLTVADPDSYGIRKMKLDEFMEISTNEHLIFIPKDKILNYKTNNKFYKSIIDFLHTNQYYLLVIMLFSLVFVILTVISTFYIQILMNSNYDDLTVSLLVFLAICTLKSLFHFIRCNILVKLVHKFDFVINKNIYNRLFLLPNSYYLNRTTGEVVSRITDLEKIKGLFSDVLFNGVISLLLSFLSFIFLVFINLKLSLILVFFAILEVGIFYIFKDKLNYMIFSVKENYLKFYSYLSDTVKDISTLKYLGCNKFFIGLFNKKHLRYLDEYRIYQKHLNLEDFLINLIGGIFNIIIVSLGYYYVLINKLNLSSYFVFLFLYPYFLEPFNEIFSSYNNITDCIHSLNRVNEFYQVEEDSVFLNEVSFSIYSIKLDNVSYAYLDKRDVLVDISLVLNGGDKLLITGSSGCGKTTLIKVISGYLTSYGGVISINGNEGIDVIDCLRDRVVYIGGSDNLLNMSFRDNILLGRKVSNDIFNSLCDILKLDEIVGNIL